LQQIRCFSTHPHSPPRCAMHCASLPAHHRREADMAMPLRQCLRLGSHLAGGEALMHNRIDEIVTGRDRVMIGGEHDEMDEGR
jgi:hypothetical protein